MGNVNQGTRTHMFDKRQFKQIINQQQQNLIQQQENSQQKLFNRNHCLYVTHNNKLIEGICVNEDCSELNRRTCFDCLNQRIHDRDQQISQITRPLNADQLNNLIIYQQGLLIQQVDQILYSLYLEQLLLTNENIQETQFIKFLELKRLEKKIKSLKKNIDEIDIENYMEQQNDTNIGIYQYFQQFYDKISQIIEDQKNYLWLKQNAQSVIRHFEIQESDRIDFCEIKKNKHVVINKITETLKYKNKQLEQKDRIFLQQQIKEEGKLLHQSEQYEQAIICFKLQLEFNENDYDTFMRIGNSYYNLKKFEQSIAEYDNAIRLKPTLKLAILQKGNSLNNLFRFQEAIQMYDKAIQLNQHCVIIENNDGSINYKTKYKQCIEMNDKLHSIVLNNKGISLFNLQKYQEAILIYDQAIKLYPQYPNSYLNKGKSLHNLQRYYEAIWMYDDAISLNPWFYEAFLNKGICLKNLQNYEEAIMIFNKAIKLNDQDSDLYIYKAICLENLQRNQQAIQSYQQASQLNPQYSNDLINLEGLFQQQVHDEAVKLFEESIKLKPLYSYNFVKNEQNYILIQEYNIKTKKRYQEAIEEYSKAIKLNRQYQECYINQGILHQQQKRHEEAIVMFDNALRLNPQHAYAIFQKGESLFHLENHQKAIQMFDRVILLEPLYQQSGYINKAVSLIKLKRFQEAIYIYDKLLQLYPNDEEVYFKKAFALCEMGKKEEGVLMFDKKIQQNPLNTEAYYRKGLLLLTQFKFYEALDMFEFILLLNPQHIKAQEQKHKTLRAITGILMYSYTNRYEKARYVLDNDLELNPQELKLYSDIGCEFFQDKKYQEALIIFDKIIQLDQFNLDAYINKGCLLTRLKRYQESIQISDKIIELDPQYYNDYYYYNKGMLLILLERYEESFHIFYNKLKAQDHNFDKALTAMLALGEILSENRYIDAIHVLNIVIQMDKKKYEAYFFKALALINISRYEEAIQMFEAYFLFKNKKIIGVLIDQNYWRNDENIMINNEKTKLKCSQAYIVKGFIVQHGKCVEEILFDKVYKEIKSYLNFYGIQSQQINKYDR